MAAEPYFEPPRFIAVEGPLGVGKTELAKILSERLNARLLLDPTQNPFLEDFYKDRSGAAFPAQLSFLVERFKQMRELDLSSSARLTVVSDYIYEKDKLFACVNLNDEELKLYDQFYQFFAEQIPTADLVVYLQATTADLKERISKRKNPFESQISTDYLEEMIQAYEHFFFHYKASNLLVVDTSEIDFVDRNEDLQELFRRLQQPVRGTQYFLPLGSVSPD